MDCRVCAATGDPWLMTDGSGSGGGGGQMLGGAFSHESEHDLAAMVSDFLENGSSCGADSRCSSDSDSGFCELANLADKISFYDLQGAVKQQIHQFFENCSTHGLRK